MRLVPALLLCSLALGPVSCDAREGEDSMPMKPNAERVIALPGPARSSPVSLEESLQRRRSVRIYSRNPLELGKVAQLLWAAQGITAPGRGYRTAPSAGATFPLEVLVAVGSVSGLRPGLYRYRPQNHSLELAAEGDLRPALQRAALNQSALAEAPATVVIAAVPARTEARYGQRAMRYVYMEAGHAAQNLCLQATALDIGTVVIGAFRDAEIAAILGLGPGEIPLYLIPAVNPEPLEG